VTKKSALGIWQTTMQRRFGRPTDQQDLAAYLSREDESEFRRNTNAISTTCTNARKAFTRKKVEWFFENFKPYITFKGKTLHDREAEST
jgi:hypothetical protein